jgi:hypothetical protein
MRGTYLFFGFFALFLLSPVVAITSTITTNSGWVDQSDALDWMAFNVCWASTNYPKWAAIYFGSGITDNQNYRVIANTSDVELVRVQAVGDIVNITLNATNTGNSTCYWIGQNLEGATRVKNYKFVSTPISSNGATLNGYYEDTNSANFNNAYLYANDGFASIRGMYRIDWENNTFVPVDNPPSILSINLTSEGGVGQLINMSDKTCDFAGCTIPATSDTTPTFTVITASGAYCRIGITNSNYTNLTSLRECDGGGSSFSTCTIRSEDEIHEGNSLLYIGCKNTDGLENISSSSGAFKIYLSQTNYEHLGRMAIEGGAQTTLGSKFTTYTDQKLYGRNSANNQFSGRFDKVVKYLNKIWAFNVLTGNQTPVGGFNITPTLYILEFRNSTPSQINSTVQNLISSTR